MLPWAQDRGDWARAGASPPPTPKACDTQPIRVAPRCAAVRMTKMFDEGWTACADRIAAREPCEMAERPGMHEQRHHHQGLPPARTPKNGWLMPTFNPQSTGESPVFLPVLTVRGNDLSWALTASYGVPVAQIEPSPTTGIQHIIPPLFHGSAARLTLANRQEALNKTAENNAMLPASREPSPPLVVRSADRVKHNLGFSMSAMCPEWDTMALIRHT